MKKLLFFTLAAFLVFLVPATQARASILTIDEEGRVVLNVLAEEYGLGLDIPESESVEVKEKSGASLDERIKIQKDGGKISLLIGSESGGKNLDITGLNEEILEIKERPEIQNISVSLINGVFVFHQKGIEAETEFSINVDPGEAKVSLTTPTGEKYLSVLPYDAYATVLRSKLISDVSGKKGYLIDEDGGLRYLFKGDKVFNLLNIYKHAVPVEIKLSASTGEIVGVDSPTWFRLIGFLFR